MESARKLFDEVPKRDVTWNAMIADYVLCASNEQALQMFDEMRNLGEKPDEGNKFRSSGDGFRSYEHHTWKCAYRYVFWRMRDKAVSSWNSMMGWLAFHGHTKESVNLFKEMQSHAGKVEEGRKYFNLMKNVYRIVPNIKHCRCMVDLLGRAGLLNDGREWDFVLLSNIYASRGERQGDVEVKKEPGYSLIETDNSALLHFLFDCKPKSC
ncbi:unnamed protein product [Malus baccata var. baccata]